jgi:hypothetical protein
MNLIVVTRRSPPFPCRAVVEGSGDVMGRSGQRLRVDRSGRDAQGLQRRLYCARAGRHRAPGRPALYGTGATLGWYDAPLGPVAQGREASFLVLDRDIFTIDASKIHQTRVDQTWVRGERVYERR